jgi:hypothetical protein
VGSAAVGTACHAWEGLAASPSICPQGLLLTRSGRAHGLHRHHRPRHAAQQLAAALAAVGGPPAEPSRGGLHGAAAAAAAALLRCLPQVPAADAALLGACRRAGVRDACVLHASWCSTLALHPARWPVLATSRPASPAHRTAPLPAALPSHCQLPAPPAKTRSAPAPLAAGAQQHVLGLPSSSSTSAGALGCCRSHTHSRPCAWGLWSCRRHQRRQQPGPPC